MLDIYLCEDDKIQLNRWKKITENYILMAAESCTLRCTTTRPDELLNVIKTKSHIGLYFLDIDSQSPINGLELALEIRKLDPRGYIVFITADAEMKLLTFQYKVEAMDCIFKDETDSFSARFCACIKAALINQSRLLKLTHRALTIKSNGITYTIDQNDILYISTTEIPRKIVIHTENGIKQVNGSLKEFFNSLHSSFFQCSRSAIVNLSHIKKYELNKNQLVLDNAEVIPISVRLKPALRKKLQNT